MTSCERIFCLLVATAAILSASLVRSEAILEASEPDASVVERASRRLRAAIAAAHDVAESHLAARAELDRLRATFENTSELLALLGTEAAVANAMSDAERRCIVAQRQIAAAAALEQMRRDRLNAHMRSMFPLSVGAPSPVSFLHLRRICSLTELRTQASRFLAQAEVFSGSVDEFRSQLARSGATVERTRSELEEALFRVEEAGRRLVAVRSRVERGSRSAEAADGPEAASLPPTRASLSVLFGNDTGFVGETAAELRFRLPLRGEIAQRFGERRGGQRSRGVVLSADRPQPVLAPGNGVVAYAGPFRDIGLLLIIEHRNAYHSLVIGASRLEVRAGDVVTEGQAVGWLDRGPSGHMDLYLELRRVGEPVDPMPVLSAHEGEVEG